MDLNSSDVERVSGLLRELYAHTDAATLPHHIVRLLHKLIPADSAVYNSFDFRSGEMLVVHDHGPDGDKYLPALQQHIQKHPLLEHVRRHWRDGAAALSEVVTQRELRGLEIYSEFLHPLRIERQLGLLVEDKEYGVTAVALQRDGGDFSQRDKDVLTLLQPHLIQAYKNAADLTQVRAERDHSTHALRLGEVGVIRLTAALKIEWLSNHAARWLAKYFPGDRERSADRLLPLALESRLRQQTQHKGIPRPAGPAHWLIATERAVLVIRRLARDNGGFDLVLSEQRDDLEPRQLESLGLSRREAEVLVWVAQGKTNGEIAVVLSLSRRTVDKHVERILAKLGVESRVGAALCVERWRKSGS